MNNHGEPQATLEDIFDLSWDWRRSVLLMQAHSCGLFDAVAEGYAGADVIADKLGYDRRSVYLTCLALTGIGFMEKSGDKFRNTKTAERFLVKQSKEYKGAVLDLALRQMRSWMSIPRVLKTGVPIAKPAMTPEETEEWDKVFIMAMDDLAVVYGDQMIDLLPVEDGMNLLDIGAGPARYLIKLAKKFPALTATAFDRPATEKIVRDNIEVEGLADRIRFVGGDFTRDFFGERCYDGVLISNVLRALCPDKARDLVRRSVEALSDGGFLTINVIPMGKDEGIGPGAIFAVQLMLGTGDGQIHSGDNLRGWMKEAGLSIESQTFINSRSNVITGRKH